MTCLRGSGETGDGIITRVTCRKLSCNLAGGASWRFQSCGSAVRARIGEGLRIGTVRRPPRGVPKADWARRDIYDVWLPKLAPSEELLKLGHRRRRTRSGGLSAPLSRRDEGSDKSRLLDTLAALSHHGSFAVGCYCENESRCHRSVLRELLAQRGADIVPEGASCSKHFGSIALVMLTLLADAASAAEQVPRPRARWSSGKRRQGIAGSSPKLRCPAWRPAGAGACTRGRPQPRRSGNARAQQQQRRAGRPYSRLGRCRRHRRRRQGREGLSSRHARDQPVLPQLDRWDRQQGNYRRGARRRRRWRDRRVHRARRHCSRASTQEPQLRRGCDVAHCRTHRMERDRGQERSARSSCWCRARAVFRSSPCSSRMQPKRA